MTPIFSTNQSQMCQFFEKRGYPASVVQAGHHRAQLITYMITKRPVLYSFTVQLTCHLIAVLRDNPLLIEYTYLKCITKTRKNFKISTVTNLKKKKLSLQKRKRKDFKNKSLHRLQPRNPAPLINLWHCREVLKSWYVGRSLRGYIGQGTQE